MDAKARLGRWILISVIVVTALCELALAAANLQAGRFRGTQVVRGLLTGWLLWRVWDGAGWARWLVAGLFLAAAGYGFVLGVTSPAVEGRPEVVALMIGFGAVCMAVGVGLASPWVGAYQAARRGRAEYDRVLDRVPAAPPDPGDER